jgi:hypothetical protein
VCLEELGDCAVRCGEDWRQLKTGLRGYTHFEGAVLTDRDLVVAVGLEPDLQQSGRAFLYRLMQREIARIHGDLTGATQQERKILLVERKSWHEAVTPPHRT